MAHPKCRNKQPIVECGSLAAAFTQAARTSRAKISPVNSSKAQERTAFHPSRSLCFLNARLSTLLGSPCKNRYQEI